MKSNKFRGIGLLMMGVLMLAVLVNCAYTVGLTDSMYKLLLTSQVSYDTGMRVAVDMYKQGRITEADKAKIIEIGKEYAEAHNQAVKALTSYEKTKSDTDQARLKAQVEIATQALSKLLELLQPYLTEVK